MLDPRYAPLFEPVKIGPVVAPNRFYQVPHCAGMGYNRPQMMAAMRGVKAEGGWGVVCTEYCSIHPSSDDMPFPHASIWDQDDVANLKLMTDAVHMHGSLAGVELWYGGRSAANLYSRQASYGATSKTNDAMVGMPVQTQAMTLDDIVELRGWFQAATRRAMEAGFDIVYVYANHHYLLSEFLSAESNTRTDQYGGSPENRIRLIREIIEETLESVNGKCAVAVRYSIPADINDDPNELFGMFETIADLPDLWDITVTDYGREMGSSRFIKEASNQAAVAKIKSATSKPVVSVGRFTSPDTMLKQITSGTQDFIGAARPSVADPYLPNKIKTGRLDDIRECIGCNICYAHDSLNAPLRCTQNPTMGEEWRRGWHPDRIAKRHADESVLIIGGGPAGLEAACALGQRGYVVTLAEAGTELGGRLNTESRLPGLSEWARVRDWRLTQLAKLSNVSVYPQNKLDADTVLDFDSQHIIVATGARWRSDGVGRYLATAFDGHELDSVISVDAILDGREAQGHVIIYDDDHYYLASAIALKLRADNIAVTLVTPEARVGGWSHFTTEQIPVIRQLIDAGVEMMGDKGLASWTGKSAQLACAFSGAMSEIEADFLIPVTARIPNDELYLELESRKAAFQSKGGISLQRIGDCRMPGIIATAVYDGHKIAQELGETATSTEIRRERFIATKPE